MINNATKTFRIIIFIILVICILGGLLWKKERKIIQAYQDEINNYLLENYPEESFKITYFKKSSLNTDECKIFDGECKMYETIPGKYIYSFKVKDSNNIEFIINYKEAYDDNESIIEENYDHLRNMDAVEVYFSSKISEVLDKDKTKYLMGEVSTSSYYGTYQIYDFPLVIYESNMQNLLEIVDKIYNNVFKVGKFEFSTDKEYEIQIDIYILNNIDIYNSVKDKKDFEDLSFCHFNQNDNASSKYICSLKKDGESKDTLIQYRLSEDKYAGGPIFGPDKYYISISDKVVR